VVGDAKKGNEELCESPFTLSLLSKTHMCPAVSRSYPLGDTSIGMELVNEASLKSKELGVAPAFAYPGDDDWEEPCMYACSVLFCYIILTLIPPTIFSVIVKACIQQDVKRCLSTEPVVPNDKITNCINDKVSIKHGDKYIL
jgi:hypothetical protein